MAENFNPFYTPDAPMSIRLAMRQLALALEAHEGFFSRVKVARQRILTKDGRQMLIQATILDSDLAELFNKTEGPAVERSDL